MHMRSILLLACLLIGGCFDDSAWVLPESAAIDIVRDEMLARGIDARDTTRTVTDMPVCVADSPCRTITLPLDGWDDVKRVGFAYITSDERGLPHDTRLEADEAEAIQDELDQRIETEGIVLVFRQWAHETEGLARDGFLRSVRAALDTHGL